MIATPPCTAAQVTAYDSGAIRHGSRFVTTIVLSNDSAKACTISGYPELTFLFSPGRPESVVVRLTTHDANFTSPAPATIAIQPTGRVAFFLGYPKADPHGYSCDAISTIAISGFPKNGTLRLPDTISPCSAVNVSPYFRPHT
jgi:Protein of unknown function (DUF4232)